MIVNLNVTESIPNVEKLLCLYLPLMCTNCSGERSFSRLKLLKPYYDLHYHKIICRILEFWESRVNM